MTAGMNTELCVVGIDPGTTAGVAILDLNGDLVDYASRKNFSKDRIIQFIVENGRPLIVATDVSPAPSLVRDIASNTGSILSVPDEDLDRRYKEELVADFHVADGDSHVLDALAASEYARREQGPRMDEIRSRVRKEGVEEHLGDVIDLVLKGSISISRAVSEVADVEEDEVEGEASSSEDRDWRKIAERRKDRIDLLETKVSNLQEHLREQEDEEPDTRVYEEELRRRNRVIQDLKRDLDEKSAALERTESEVAQMREGVDRMDQGWLRVPKVDSLSETDSGTVFLENYSGGEISRDVETVVTPGPSRELEEEGLAVVDIGEVENVLEIPGSYIIAPEELEKQGDPERFMEWLEAYRKR